MQFASNVNTLIGRNIIDSDVCRKSTSVGLEVVAEVQQMVLAVLLNQKDIAELISSIRTQDNRSLPVYKTRKRKPVSSIG